MTEPLEKHNTVRPLPDTMLPRPLLRRLRYGRRFSKEVRNCEENLAASGCHRDAPLRLANDTRDHSYTIHH